ncbi:hypothetical protein R4Q14_09250 [Brachyspira intermedia]|uniref:hypothetical protein n=1 Tax=Brachyspira intermedia TaxID=84377 RepID=UPI003005FB6A
MSNQLLNDEEFLKIKKELDDIFATIDRLASPWIDLGNAVAGMGVLSAFFINPLVGLGAAAAGAFLGYSKKQKALEDKRKKFYEILPTLKNTAITKMSAVKQSIIFLNSKISLAEQVMINDSKLILSENNKQNKESLISGISSSFKSYCKIYYMLELCQYALDTFEAWLNEEYSADYQCPNIDNSNAKCTMKLYNNSDFYTVASNNPTIGTLFIVNNNNDDEVKFIPKIVAENIYRSYSYDDIIFKNRNNTNLRFTNLYFKYKSYRENNVLRSLYGYYDKMNIVLPIVFIISFFISMLADANAYNIGIVKFIFLSILPASVITGITALIWFISYHYLFNIRFKFYTANLIKSALYLLSMLLILIGIPTVYGYLYSNNYRQKNIEYIDLSSNEISNLIENKQFDDAYNKNDSLYLKYIYPLADINEAGTVKKYKKELYDNMSTNFFINFENALNNKMDYSNYQYVFDAYNERNKYYKKIPDENYKNEIKELLSNIDKEIDKKRHEYLLSEVNIINNLINTDKSKAIELINDMKHFSKDKFKLSDDKKFIIFNDTISYKEYWEKQREELLSKISN